MHRPHPHPGLFIAIEGLDGSGLSTQTELVVNLLRLQGVKVFGTKEPTNNVIGGVIRGTLTGAVGLPHDSLQLLFAADRAHHLEREVIPMLKDGNIVVSDRYFWTSVAYGGVDLDREWLLKVNENFLIPDLTIFLDSTPKVSLKRIKRDRFQVEIFEKEKQLQKVRQNYQWLMKRFPRIFTKIDATRDREEIAKEIVGIIQRLPKFGRLKKQ